MTRFSAAAAFVLALLSFDSNAQFRIFPLPGTTPQETCFSCVFPNEIGVIAKDGLGLPIPGLQIRFTAETTNLGLVRYDDFCCVAYDEIKVTTGPDGTARVTAITIFQPGRTGSVRAFFPGADIVRFTLSSTEQRATQLVPEPFHYQYAQLGTDFPAPWTFRALDANGQPVPRTMLAFYGGNYGGVQAKATFNGGDEWAFGVADANGVVVSPTAHAASKGEEDGFGGITASVKAPALGEQAPMSFGFYFVTDYAITSHSAAIVGNPPDSVQLNSIAAAPYSVRVLDASGNPAVGMPVHFVTGHVDDEMRCMSFFAQGSGDEIIHTDANGIATASVLYGDVPGPCTLRIWTAGITEPIVREVYVFDGDQVVVRPKHDWVTSRARHDFNVILEFFHNGRAVQPGNIEWVEVKRLPFSFPVGITGDPTYTFANNAATIHLRANQWPGVYDLDIAYTVANHKRVHVLQLP